MNMTDIIIDKSKFEQQFDRFIRYVLSTSSETHFLSFSSNETTSKQEGYKLDVYEEAKQNLSYKKWIESDIGTGRIHGDTVKALRISGNRNNLVNWRLIERYANREGLKSDLSALERTLFNLFNNIEEESVLFGQLVESIGANYSLIAYFFFIKDKQRFLPISTNSFDKAFQLIGIEEFSTTQHCTWDNYQKYNLIVEEVQSLLNEKIKGEVYLLDAHSFLWMISGDLESDLKPEFKDFQWRDPEVSTVKREVLQRQGQEVFRKKLLQYWKNKCSVTKLDYDSLLVASHIKPWKDSTDQERFDVHNGLLLTPNLDKLFDKGLISFASDGQIIISSRLSETQKKLLGLNNTLRIDDLEIAHSYYLEYHRNNIFMKS
jgi:hypothetical protein